MAEQFVEPTARAHALESETDERGCVRFNVLQDDAVRNVYYWLTRSICDEDAVTAQHRAAPHTRCWKGAADTLDGPVDAHRLHVVVFRDEQTPQPCRRRWIG